MCFVYFYPFYFIKSQSAPDMLIKRPLGLTWLDLKLPSSTFSPFPHRNRVCRTVTVEFLAVRRFNISCKPKMVSPLTSLSNTSMIHPNLGIFTLCDKTCQSSATGLRRKSGFKPVSEAPVRICPVCRRFPGLGCCLTSHCPHSSLHRVAVAP